MNAAILHALLQNAALLLAMAFVVDAATNRHQLKGRPLWQVLVGIIIGGFGIGVILASFRFESGIVFDTRSVLLAISGLFLGPIPTMVAMAITAAYRLLQGGIAAGPGAAVILASGGIGIVWRRYHRGALEDISWRELYALGVAVHVVMLALMLMLPWETARRVLVEISLPVLLVYPVATVALGLLLAGRRRRERASTVLAESEERYRSLFANNQAVMLIVDPDSGAIVDANPAAARFYGWTCAQLQQMPLARLNVLPPEQLQTEMGRAQAAKSYYALFTHRRADGSRRDVEVFSGSVTIGGRSLLHSIIHDITERRRAEAASRESAALLRMAGGIMRFGGWSVNLAEDRVVWSDEVSAIHEMPPGYFPPLEEAMTFYAPEWREKIKEVFNACAREGKPFDEEMEIISVRGRRVWVRAVGTAIRDEEGKIIRVQGAFQDIDEHKQAQEKTRRLLAELSETQRVLLSVIEDQKKAEVERERLLARAETSRRTLLSVVEDQRRAEDALQRLNAELEQRVRDRTAQLEAANQELEAFSYSVSHDLRTPLRAMDGFSQALLEDCAGQLDERGRNYLGRVRAAAARMGGLIEDLLHLSRVTRAELRRERVDLSALAVAVVEELRQAQPDRTVEVEIAAGLVGEGDARLLRVVLANLLGNAWKFTGRQPHGRIEFGVTSGAGRVASGELGDPGTRPTVPVTFFVRDNGAGFDLAYAEKLFGAFQRLHSVAEFPGTGIGLASVQRIIHRHGGRVWAEGVVGLGATFYFTLTPKLS